MFEIVMVIDDFLIQLVKYCTSRIPSGVFDSIGSLRLIRESVTLTFVRLMFQSFGTLIWYLITSPAFVTFPDVPFPATSIMVLSMVYAGTCCSKAAIVTNVEFLPFSLLTVRFTV